MKKATIIELRHLRKPSYETRYTNHVVNAVYKAGDSRVCDLTEDDFFEIVVDFCNNKFVHDEYELQRRNRENAPLMLQSCSPLRSDETVFPVPQHMIDSIIAQCLALLAEKEKNDV